MSVGDIMSTLGVVQYTGGYHDECGGYHEYTGVCSVHQGFNTNLIVFPMTFLHIYHDIPRCILCKADLPVQPGNKPHSQNLQKIKCASCSNVRRHAPSL